MNSPAPNRYHRSAVHLRDTGTRMDEDPHTVSPASDASTDVGEGPGFIAEWRNWEAEPLELPVPANVPQKAARATDRKFKVGKTSGAPTPSKRQGRTHKLVRGAESRAVRTRSRDIYTGDVPMARLKGKLLAGEGFIEIHAWIVLEFILEDMVDAFAQADKQRIWMFGVQHDWTPDGLIHRERHRELLIEMKPLEAVQPEKGTSPALAVAMRARVEGMKAAAAAQGRDFLLLTEHELRMEPRFHNAKMMLRAHGANIGEDVVRLAMSVLCDMDEVASVRDLAELMPTYRRSMLMIACILDRAGHIRLDRQAFFAPDVEFENYLSAQAGEGVGGRS